MECEDCGTKLLPHSEQCPGCGAELESGDIDPLIGTVLSEQYRLDAIIGEGSMGCVYAATQLSLDKEVAVKVLHAHVSADPKVRKRFAREARTTGSLKHPNTVEILDFGEDQGLLYLTMELLDGPDFLDIINEERPFSPARIIDLLSQTLLALEEAHDAGIVHRDLKAENIMVIEDHQGNERVKVCDFGIAKLMEADGTAITVSGFVCGTPEYIAPEQAKGEDIDGRADLYALGCVLFQMLTGDVPFRGASALATITKHLTDPIPRPRRVAPDAKIFWGLERVCLRALSKDRELRFSDAKEMREALAKVLEQLGPLAEAPLGTHDEDPTAPKKPTSPWKVAAIACSVLFLGAAALWASGEPETSEAPRSQTSPEAPAASHTSMGPLRRDGDSSPNANVATPEPENAANDRRETAQTPETAQPETSQADSTPSPASEASTTPRNAAPDAGSGGSGGGENAATETGSANQTGANDTASTSESTPTTSPNPEAPRERPAASTAPAETVPEPSAMVEAAPLTRFEEGRQAFLDNDIPGAIAAFEEAARQTPNHAQTYRELGRAQMRAGQVAAAVQAYRRYLELRPEAPDREYIRSIVGGP